MPQTKKKKIKRKQIHSLSLKHTPFQITKTQTKKLNQTINDQTKPLKINCINKPSIKHYICKEEHPKLEPSLETLENIVTKRRKEWVKLLETWHRALDCSGNEQRRLRGERGEMKTFVANLLGSEEAD